jgi:hypothetical protein
MRAKSSLAIVLRAVKLSTPLIVLTAAAPAASYRVYPGDALPRQQVAVLVLSNVEAITVDEYSTLVCEDADPQRTARTDAVTRSFLRWPPAPRLDRAIAVQRTTGSLVVGPFEPCGLLQRWKRGSVLMFGRFRRLLR